MKGVILAGGLGSRLRPLTKVTNKHLLPVYNKPMIYFPIETLVGAGIDDIMVVTGGNNAGDFLRLLGNGKQFGLRHIDYAYQEGEGGIADALSLAEHFVGNDRVAVVLGDNLVEDSVRPYVDSYLRQPSGAKILLKEVSNPQRFGVARLSGNRIIEVIEKPFDPPSSYAVIGIYMYDPRVFEIIKGLSPSKRGELEISDVNNRYIAWGDMSFDILSGWWTDAGTIESLHRAGQLVAEQSQRARVGVEPGALH